MTVSTPKMTLPALLSFNAGFVNTAGFLALQGLFTAHVTGNFVTLGASSVLGISGAIAKLLALPIFCIVVILTRVLSSALSERNRPALKIILVLKVLLLVAGAIEAIQLGPFTNGDSWPAILTGMTLVSAMAIQNTVHRIHLANVPPTTLMTGTTTQIMIDLADLIRKPAMIDVGARTRLWRMSGNVLMFALGCGVAALMFAKFNVWSFALPPVLGLVMLLIRLEKPRLP